MFFNWLLQQRTRADEIGDLAQIAFADRSFPTQTQKLHHLLRWCGNDELLRRSVKRAYREWRSRARYQQEQLAR